MNQNNEEWTRTPHNNQKLKNALSGNKLASEEKLTFVPDLRMVTIISISLNLKMLFWKPIYEDFEKLPESPRKWWRIKTKSHTIGIAIANNILKIQSTDWKKSANPSLFSSLVLLFLSLGDFCIDVIRGGGVVVYLPPNKCENIIIY